MDWNQTGVNIVYYINELFETTLYIIQIYPGSESYLRKIPVERRGKFHEPPYAAREIFLYSKPVFFANNPH
jgi:hypothetical protein